jgi:hypothetical protein
LRGLVRQQQLAEHASPTGGLVTVGPHGWS